MKISTASKKVLASALSAAMVVAFAPTVAFGTELNSGTGEQPAASDAAVRVIYTEAGVEKYTDFNLDKTGTGAYDKSIEGVAAFAAAKKGTIQLLSDITADAQLYGNVKVDLAGKTWTSEKNAAAPIKVLADKAGTTVTTARLVQTLVSDGATQAAYAETTSANTAKNHMAMSSDEVIYRLASIPANGVYTAETFAAATKVSVAAGSVYSSYQDVTVTVDGVEKTIKAANSTAVSVSAGTIVEINGKDYKFNNQTVSANSAPSWIVKTETKTTGAYTSTAVQIIDTVGGGKISGETSYTADGETEATVTAEPAIDVADGAVVTLGDYAATKDAKKVNKGFTVSTGADAVHSSGATVKAVEGNIANVRDVIVEAIGGSYKDGAATKTQTTVKAFDDEIAGNLTDSVVKANVKSSIDVDAAVVGATVNGTVKGSDIEVVAGDASATSAAAGQVDVTAVALTAKGGVEGSTVKATAGSTSKGTGATHDAVTHADAIIANASAAATYKKNTVTAAVGTGYTGQTLTADAIYATSGSEVTVNSGTYDGILNATATYLSLAGGAYTDQVAHTGAGSKAALIGSDGASDAIYKAVCVSGTDYVYRYTLPTTFVKYTAGDNNFTQAADTGVLYNGRNDIAGAFADVFKAAVAGTETEASVDYLGGVDAKALAALLTDADESAKLKVVATETTGTKAVTTLSGASEALKAQAAAWNEVVEGVDSLAAAEAKVAGSYTNLSVELKALGKKDDGTFKDAGVEANWAAAATLNKLGKAADTTSTNHGDESSTAGTARSLKLSDKIDGVTNEKNAVALATYDGKALSYVEYTKTATKDGYYATAIPATFATTRANADSVKSELEKLIEALGGKIESGNATIAELTAQLVKLQDKDAASSIKGITKTIKTKKGVTGKTYTTKVKAVTSDSGAVSTFKKANTAGKSKITVAKSGKITIKKGLKKGTYKVKVKGTVGASSKTVYAKIVIK